MLSQQRDTAPEVCVIMPCYNQGAYIAEALESLLQQTYTGWQCIIVNDGSTDNTADVVKPFISKDSRIKYIEITNSGPSVARNMGIDRTAATYILPLDADDKISANYIQQCLYTIKTTNATVVYGAAEKFGKVIGKWDLKEYSWKQLLFQNMIHSCSMYRKSDWEAIGGYDAAMVDGIEDWEFWINLIRETGTVIKLTDITFYWRVKEVSRTTGLNKEKDAKMQQLIYKKHSQFYDPFFTNPIKLYQDWRTAENIIAGILKSPTRFAIAKFIARFKRK